MHRAGFVERREAPDDVAAPRGVDQYAHFVSAAMSASVDEGALELERHTTCGCAIATRQQSGFRYQP